MRSIPREVLARWAAAHPTVRTLYVFGSYARGDAYAESDLDLAFDFTDSTEALSELIENAAPWKAELTRLTGIKVKDLYLSTDPPAQGPKLEVFRRE
jgi:predicted nucleotidyltransferase